MELKLEKKCRPAELEVGKRYAIGACGRYPFIVTCINYERGFVLLNYLNDPLDGVVYLDNSFVYYYEFPLSSLEKELL